MRAAQLKQKTFFRYADTRDNIQNILTERIKAAVQKRQSEVLDSRNMFGYKHGTRWSTRNNSSPDEMRSIGAEHTLYKSDVINHDTEVIARYVNKLAEQLFDNFMRDLFQTVSKSSDAVGNSVNMKDHGGTFADGFLAALKKIEFGVDRYGRPSAYDSRGNDGISQNHERAVLSIRRISIANRRTQIKQGKDRYRR